MRKLHYRIRREEPKEYHLDGMTFLNRQEFAMYIKRTYHIPTGTTYRRLKLDWPIEALRIKTLRPYTGRWRKRTPPTRLFQYDGGTL